MQRFIRRLHGWFLNCLIVLLAVTPSVSAQFSVDGTRPDLRWRGVGMEELWRVQSVADGGRSTLQHVVPHVSSSDLRTVFEVVVGDTRRAFVPEMTDRWGRYLGEAGAERQADIERRVLDAQGLPAKIDKKEIRAATLFAQTSAGVLQAIDAETGQIRWTLVVGSRARPASAPGVSDTAVASVVGTTLNVVSAADGTFLWSRRLNGIPAGFVAIGGELILVPRLRNGVDLLSLTNSELPRMLASNGFALGGVSASPQQKLAWPTSLGYVQVADTDTGRIAFRIETRNPALHPVSFADDGTLCIATSDGTVVAANSKNGAIRWQFLTGDGAAQSPMIFEGAVCVVTRRGELFCVDLATGRLRWRRAGIQSWVGVSSGRILAVDHQDRLVALEWEQGNQVGSSALNGLQPLVPHVLSDRVYLTNGSGLIIALRPVGGIWPSIFAPLIEVKPADDAAVETPATTSPATVESEAPAMDEEPSENDDAPPEDDPFGGDNPFGEEPADDPFGDG